jgi:iron complex outermembrane receptor protein
MSLGRILGRRTALYASISLIPILLAPAYAQTPAPAANTDIGSVDIQSNGIRTGLPPLSSDAAVGSKAPAGSAPALAPAQGRLDGFEPGSVVSDKVLRDVVPPSSDYNEAGKYTPGFLSNNSNGLLGDSKSGWRGFQDGQFNVTFDGIPFGDANDPTHHSAAYFPSVFLGNITIDRGPGAASQVGYATFGGTLALRSIDLQDQFGGSVTASYGTFNTSTTAVTVQTGLLGDTGVRGLFQYSYAGTEGALQDGKVHDNQFLGKVEKTFNSNVTVTLFGSYGREDYNNVNSITYPQLLAYGKTYGQVNGNPKSQEYVGYNNSQKATDMEYIGVKGGNGDWQFDNKLYTYAYYYPSLQNNGANQSIEGNASIANGGTINSVSVPTFSGGKVKYTILGVTNGDVIGYVKDNNYRAFGDILNVSRVIDAGVASGTFRTGVWIEHVDNDRLQEYTDYTTGFTFPQLGNNLQASYKLDLKSHITTVQPFIEYEWHPLDRLTITPGYKFEAFTRDHDALVNQTTLQPIHYSHTYDANLPFLAARYKVSDEVTVYAQASQGFLAPTVSAYYVFNPADGGIKPQTTNNYQAGAVYKSGRITADVDVYQVTAHNFPVTNTLATGETIYTDGGTARYRGFEAEGSYNIVTGLSAYVSGAVISAKYISGAFNGERVGDAPDFTAAGGFIFDNGMIFGSLLQKFTGGYYGSSGQKSLAATPLPSLNYVKPYNTTDLVLGIRSDVLHDWGFGKTASLKLGISNIFDHKNTVEIAGDPTGLASINNTTLTYSFLPGRTIYGALTIGF